MARIAALDAGTYYHHRALHGSRYRDYFEALIYAPELGRHDLARFDAVIFTCRTDPDRLIPHREKIARYLATGGTVVAMGSTEPQAWLPNVRWTETEVNFWWWLSKGADPGLRLAAPDHGLFRFITLGDATWHYHGYFRPPEGALSVIDLEGAGSLFYEDRVTMPGRMIVTSLDPFFHYGSHFMPATTRFLDGFLPWLHADLDGKTR